jgi:hypothetical protein
MRYMICYKLILSARSVIRHCFHKPAHSFLVVGWNAPIAPQQLLIFRTQLGKWLRQPGACNDVEHVNSEGCDSREVCGIGISRPTFITPLGVAIYAASKGQIFLFKAEPRSFFAKALARTVGHFPVRRTIFQSSNPLQDQINDHNRRS